MTADPRVNDATVTLVRTPSGNRVHHPDCRYVNRNCVPWMWANAHVSTVVVSTMIAHRIARCAACWPRVAAALAANDRALTGPYDSDGGEAS